MALPATDNFATTSTQTLTAYSANWTINNGGFNVNEPGDYALPTTGDDIAHWNVDTFNDNQYAQVSIASAFIGEFLGVALRCHASAATAYCVFATDDTTYIYRFVSGTGTQLTSQAGTWAQNDIIRGEVETIDANTVRIRVYKNGGGTPVLTFDDTNAARLLSGYAGIYGYGPNGGGVDNWEGGNLTTDTTPPTLSSQTVNNVTSSGGTPVVSTDEGSGTIYMVVVSDGDVPSVTQIKAGQNSSGGAALAAQNQAVSAIGTQIFSAVSGLSPSTAYDVWFVHTDAASNNSSAVKADFTTNTVSTEPILTDVDTDEIVRSDQTGVAVTGTNMGAANANRTFSLRQGSVAVNQTETGTGTATGATLSIVTEPGGAAIKFGAAIFRVTRDDALFADLSITVTPPTGQLYTDLASIYANANNRITAIPDIAIGDQLQVRGVGGGTAPTGLVLVNDGTFYFSSGNTPATFDVRAWAANDQTWGAWATQTVGNISNAVSLGAAIQKAQQISIGSRAAIQKIDNSLTATINAVLLKITALSAANNAVLQKDNNIRSAILAAAIEKALIQVTSLSGAIAAQGSTIVSFSISLSAALQKLFSIVTELAAVVSKQQTIGTNSQAALEKLASLTVSMDVSIRGISALTVASVVISKITETNANISGYISTSNWSTEPIPATNWITE